MTMVYIRVECFFSICLSPVLKISVPLRISATLDLWENNDVTIRLHVPNFVLFVRLLNSNHTTHQVQQATCYNNGLKTCQLQYKAELPWSAVLSLVMSMSRRAVPRPRLVTIQYGKHSNRLTRIFLCRYSSNGSAIRRYLNHYSYKSICQQSCCGLMQVLR